MRQQKRGRGAQADDDEDTAKKQALEMFHKVGDACEMYKAPEGHTQRSLYKKNKL